jgi:hypothetical protein
MSYGSLTEAGCHDLPYYLVSWTPPNANCAISDEKARQLDQQTHAGGTDMDSQPGQRGHDFLPTGEALSTIPGAYGSEHVPVEDKTIWLHYFSAVGDHYLAEVWYEPGQEGEPGQWMAFGYARLAAFPEGAEWGYINMGELEQLRVEDPRGLPVIVERDLDWEPKKFSQIVPAHKEPGNTGHDLALDQDQAATVIAALEDAAALRRETIGYCADCEQSPAAPCPDHQHDRERADEYDELRCQLEAPPGDHDDPRRDEPRSEDYEASHMSDTAHAVAPEVANIIADYARAVNRPAGGPAGEPYTSADEAVPFEASEPHSLSPSYAERLAAGQADPGPTERQLEDWNIHNDHADRLEPDYPEAGE